MGKKILLIIDYDGDHYSLFKGAVLKNGDTIQVEQTRWKYIHVEARFVLQIVPIFAYVLVLLVVV
jgi:hypothetical protein